MNASISYSTYNLNGHLGLLEQNYGLDFPLPVSCMWSVPNVSDGKTQVRSAQIIGRAYW
jgi:hypothetical protein